jgi:hypothetical protein
MSSSDQGAAESAPEDEAGAGPAHARPRVQTRVARRSNKGQAWATGLTALATCLALGLSFYNYLQADSDPQVAVFLPKIIRIFAQPQSSTTSAFVGVIIQPTYALLKTTDRTAVISDVSLGITPPGVGPLPEESVAWLSAGSSATSVQNSGISVSSDPAPIVVNQSQASEPYLLFAAYTLEKITPGKWSFTLKARRADGEYVTANSCINIVPRWSEFVNRSALGSAIMPIFRNDLGRDGDPSECYRGAF